MSSTFESIGTPHDPARRGLLGALMLAALGAGCGQQGGGPDDGPAFLRVPEAQKSVAELQIHFNQTVDAWNLVVMADSEDVARSYAAEAEQHYQAVLRLTDQIAAVVRDLQLDAGISALEAFRSGLEQAQILGHTVAELALENSNRKAVALSDGPAQEALDALQVALGALSAAAPRARHDRAELLGLRLLVSLYEVQALHPRHIREADDAAMTVQEQRMDARAAAAGELHKELSDLVRDEEALTAATTSLNRFMEIHAQILALSRRNTNVRALALSMGELREVTVSCAKDLDALATALITDGSTATR